MDREIVISAEGEEPRVAIVEDGQLVEIYIERPLTQRIVGNIYKGRVENVLPGMQAAFVNIGLDRNAFLFVDDAQPGRIEDEEDGAEESQASPPPNGRPRSITELVHEGQEVIVQIAKEPTGTKGARVTRNLTIPGRFLVLMPTADYVGVSRRIQSEEERERLKQIAYRIKSKGLGVIVRTVAEGRSEEELRQDWKYLKQAWNEVRAKSKRLPAPALLYKDLSLVQRTMRDQLNEHVTRIVVEGREEFERLTRFLDEFAPEYRDRLELYPPNKSQSLFGFYGVEEEIEKALNRRVWLKSGGYLVIDQTEALTAIDVNTGKYVGNTSDLQDTVFKTNMEAAKEIARQLRLRDIGGIIVVDFIDMEVAEHRKKVVETLVEATRYDHAKPTVLGLTQLGLVEMTRKKGRQSLRDLLTKPCPYCDGRGRVMNEETASRRVRREIRRILRNSDGEAILVEVHPSVAALLIGAGGVNLRELERETGRTIYIRGSESCHIEDMNLRALGDRASVEAKALPVKVGQRLEIKVEEPHVTNAADGIARIEGYVVDIEGGGKRVGERLLVEVTKVFRTYCKARILDSAPGNAAPGNAPAPRPAAGPGRGAQEAGA